MSLAQLFFDGLQPDKPTKSGKIIFEDEDTRRVWQAAKDCLSHGFEKNHLAPDHKVLADFASADAAGAAQRFVVTADDYGQLIQLGINFLDLDIPLRMPALPLWIEFPVRFIGGKEDGILGAAGILIDAGDENSEYLSFIYTNRYNKNFPGPESAIRFDLIDNIISIKWCWAPGGEPSDTQMRAASDMTYTAIRAVAALNVPRIVTKTSITWQPPIQKARLKRGNYPLLSFNRVKLHLPKTHQHSGDTMRREVGGGVRFHGVLGHLRRIEKPYGPDVTWVSPHWRGDPRLGVVVKERTVKVSK